MKPKLQELTREGWVGVCDLGHAQIISKGNQRGIYDPETDELTHTYTIGLDGRIVRVNVGGVFAFKV